MTSRPRNVSKTPASRPESRPRRPRLPSVALAALLMAGALPVHATALHVSLDTAALFGTAAVLAFDFTDFDSAINTVTIDDFLTDGTLGLADAPFGGVAGALPATVTLNETGYSLIELLQHITLGNTLSFNLDLTEASSGASPVDAFAFFLLDTSASQSLIATDDPTTANALFAVDIDGTRTGNVQTFNPISTQVSWTLTAPAAAPLPATLWLLAIGALAARLRERTPAARRV